MIFSLGARLAYSNPAGSSRGINAPTHLRPPSDLLLVPAVGKSNRKTMGKGPSTQSVPVSLLDTEQDGGVREQTAQEYVKGG